MKLAPVVASNTICGAEPQPLVVGGKVLLMVTPLGRSSVIEKSVRFVSSGANMSICKRELPPLVIVFGTNLFAPLTSGPCRLRVAVAGRGIPTPWSFETSVALMIFLSCPEVVPAGTITGMVMVQLPGVKEGLKVAAGIVPPSSVTDVGVEVSVPGAHVVVGVPFTSIGVGRLSVRSTPV